MKEVEFFSCVSTKSTCIFHSPKLRKMLERKQRKSSKKEKKTLRFCFLKLNNYFWKLILKKTRKKLETGEKETSKRISFEDAMHEHEGDETQHKKSLLIDIMDKGGDKFKNIMKEANSK